MKSIHMSTVIAEKGLVKTRTINQNLKSRSQTKFDLIEFDYSLHTEIERIWVLWSCDIVYRPALFITEFSCQNFDFTHNLKNELIIFNKILHMHSHWKYLGMEYCAFIFKNNYNYKQLWRLTYVRIASQVKTDKIWQNVCLCIWCKCIKKVWFFNSR